MTLEIPFKVALVTGGESGIGRGCAAALGQAGLKVAVMYYKDSSAADETLRFSGGNGITVQADVSSEASVEAAFAKVESELGVIDVLVNSAGINMAGVLVRDMPLDHWQRMINTDLTGCFLTSRRFTHGLHKANAKGAIVNISSIHATDVRPGGADYCSAKAGLRNLTETMALEEGAFGIRVNSIEPGMILTPMNQAAMDDDKVRDQLAENIPVRRAGLPEDIANVAVFLCSNQATYITGANLVVDGGLSLCLGQKA